MTATKTKLVHRLRCPICGETVPELIDQLEEELRDKMVPAIQKKKPHWTEKDGACRRCVNFFQSMLSCPSRFKQIKDRLLHKIAALHHREYRQGDHPEPTTPEHFSVSLL